MLRPNNEPVDVEAAIDELKRTAFIEATTASDKSVLLSVPLVAAVFGKRKLSVSPMKIVVEANTEILHQLGAAQKADAQYGIAPRIERLFINLAAKVTQEPGLLEEYLPIMEFIARKHPPAWLLLARLLDESDLENRLHRAKDAIERYLEVTPKTKDQLTAWQTRAEYCRQLEDWPGKFIHLSR